jgi:hypothetical protein
MAGVTDLALQMFRSRRSRKLPSEQCESSVQACWRLALELFSLPELISGRQLPLICYRVQKCERSHNRTSTGLTNAFSKKLDNHKAACALHFAYYNFCPIHKSLRVTPAMEASVTDHIWSLREPLA